MAKRSKRSPEEIKAWRDKLTALSQKVKAFTEEERGKMAAEIGTLTAEGHPLSIHNTLLLWMQYGKACAQVGGFRQWQKVGRRVIKGCHAAGYIYVPTGARKKKGADEDEEGSMRFRLVPVFDVNQTQEV